MKTLLSIDSPKYLKRLVKEINSLLLSGGSVYCEHPITKKKHKITHLVAYSKNNYIPVGMTHFHGVNFYDGMGQQIVVSREE